MSAHVTTVASRPWLAAAPFDARPVCASAIARDGTASAPRFLTASAVSELGIVLALSVGFPFMIHILPVPDDARLGARLLPMFYAPLLAVLVGRAQTAFIVALCAPWLNWLLTTHPTPPTGVVMTAQLLAFVVVMRTLLGKVGPRWFLAGIAYMVAIAAASALVALMPGLIGGRPALGWVVQTVSMSLPGVGVLLLINWLAIRFHASGPGGSGPAAA